MNKEEHLNNWILRQTECSILQFDKSMATHYPESVAYLKNSEAFYKRIVEQSNYLDAIQIINWNEYLQSDSTVLDLGGGVGWLSAYLSKYDSVKTIYNLDTSKFFLNEMMPEMIQLMSGRPEKIVPIEGLFYPLLFEDKSIDVVVASSSFHHADNLEKLLREVGRILKDNGLLFILNETPYPYFKYTISIIRVFLSIMRNTLIRKYESISPQLSSSGILYDPYLNDRAYPKWYWEKVIESSGLSIIESVNTGLPTLKNSSGIGLMHFVCKKI